MLAPGDCAALRVVLKSPLASLSAPVQLEEPSAIACCDPEPARGSLCMPEWEIIKQGQQEPLKYG